MAKRNLQREGKFNRILDNNRYRTSMYKKPSSFYALVDVRIKKKNLDGTETTENKTYVIDGASRYDAELNAQSFLQDNGVKGRITGIYPVR